MQEFLSPVGRFVQGSISLEDKIDPQTNKPKLDENGNKIKECFIALAIAKDNPEWPAFYGQIYNTARAEFPHLVGADGSITHPRFAFKVQDGDGLDNNGQSVAGKPGFAGHWIVKMGSRYLPKCFHRGKYDPAQQIQNPTETIKRGYYIRVGGTLRGNGVQPNDRQAVPGLFISPNLVELFGYGDEISSGPDATKVFGNAPQPAYMPAGMQATPAGGTVPTPGAGGGLPPVPGATNNLPPVPGAAASVPPPGASSATAGNALPPPPGAAALPPPPGSGALPPPPSAGPTYTMLPKAQGASREALLGSGWTDAQLVEHGYMTIS